MVYVPDKARLLANLRAGIIDDSSLLTLVYRHDPQIRTPHVTAATVSDNTPSESEEEQGGESGFPAASRLLSSPVEAPDEWLRCGGLNS